MLATGLADPELVHEDLVVMLAEDGMMSRDLTDAADRLEMLGRRPEWMLVVRSPRRRGSASARRPPTAPARPAHAPLRGPPHLTRAAGGLHCAPAGLLRS